MPNEIFYVFDDRKCKAEGLTKEQILNAIYEATGVMPTDVDEGFITTIVETNRNRSIHIWKGTQAEYNALETHDPLTYYIIDDDSTIDDIESDLADLSAEVERLDDEDASWTQWYKYDENETAHLVGVYKKVGKFVFYRIDIDDLSLFDGKAIELPVSIDNGGRPLSIPFFDSNYNIGRAYIYPHYQTHITNIAFKDLSGGTTINDVFGFYFTGIIRDR